MLLLITFVVLIAFYFWFNRGQQKDKQDYYAILFSVIYLAIYLFVPPHFQESSKQLGSLYGVIPTISFAAILFPNLDDNNHEIVTRTLGWLGLYPNHLKMQCSARIKRGLDKAIK